MGVWWAPYPSTGAPVAKPNYSFEKRQREQQKKLKKAEKAQRKANAGSVQVEEGAPEEAVPQVDAQQPPAAS